MDFFWSWYWLFLAKLNSGPSMIPEKSIKLQRSIKQSASRRQISQLAACMSTSLCLLRNKTQPADRSVNSVGMWISELPVGCGLSGSWSPLERSPCTLVLPLNPGDTHCGALCLRETGVSSEAPISYQEKPGGSVVHLAHTCMRL